MSSTQRLDSREDPNDSWVELSNSGNAGSGVAADPQSIYNGNLEKLLIEAQKESRTPSRANSKESSARASPKSPHSPNNELVETILEDRDPGTDWIWDWSSRPEAHPPSDWRFKHKVSKHKLSVRNTRVMKNGVFCLENLPTLLLSHACSFFLGAAVMIVCLKKYCHWAAVAPSMD